MTSIVAVAVDFVSFDSLNVNGELESGWDYTAGQRMEENQCVHYNSTLLFVSVDVATTPSSVMISNSSTLWIKIKVSEHLTDRFNDLIKNIAFYDGELDMSFN